MVTIDTRLPTTPVKRKKNASAAAVSGIDGVKPVDHDISPGAQHLIYERRTPPDRRAAEPDDSLPEMRSGEERRRRKRAQSIDDPHMVDTEA